MCRVALIGPHRSFPKWTGPIYTTVKNYNSDLNFYNFRDHMTKRGHYGRWSESDLLKAVAAYRNGETGLNKCSRIYNVPRTTIKRHADRKNATANEMKVLYPLY